MIFGSRSQVPVMSCVPRMPKFICLVDTETLSVLTIALADVRSIVAVDTLVDAEESVPEEEPELEEPELEEEPERTSWLKNTGIGQLYRGLGMRIGANVILFLLTLFVPTEDADDGWTEL